MSDDPNLNLGVGGGQPPFLQRGPSLEEEEKAMRKGNTGVLIGGAIAALIAVLGLGFVLLSGEDGGEYSAIGQQINGMKTEHFDGFRTCALPGEQLSSLRSDQDLRYAITKRARSNPRRYAEHVRADCMVKLNEHRPALRELIPPPDLADQLASLETAIEDLRVGWTEYLGEIEGAESYEEDSYRAEMNKIAKGWYDYKNVHSGLNDAIREKIQ